MPATGQQQQEAFGCFFCTDGLRGELTLVRAARALAALDGAKTVTGEHLRQVAPAVLRHRLRRDPLDESGSDVRIERAVEDVFAA